MKAFLIFVLYVAAILVTAAALEYPLYRFANLFGETSYYAFSGRLHNPVGLASLYFFLRAMRLNNARDLGYALAPAPFAANVLKGFALGVLVMLPLVGALFALDIRVFNVPHGEVVRVLGPALASGLAAGILIGIIEETFFRGAMYSAIERESGFWPALVLGSALYAMVHFIDSDLRIPEQDLDALSGLVILAHSFDAFRDPAAILDSALALFAAGAFLVMVRARTGNISWCIGLHAGWVTVIKVVKKGSYWNAQSDWSWVTGNYDQITGYLAFAWLAALTLAFAPRRPTMKDHET